MTNSDWTNNQLKTGIAFSPYIFVYALFDDLDDDSLPSLLNSLLRTLIQNQHLQPQIHPEHKTMKTHFHDIPEKFCAVFKH